MKLTSRSTAAPTDQELVKAAQPAINIAMWLASRLRYPNGSFTSVVAARTTLEDALKCMELSDCTVKAVPSAKVDEILFEVQLKPFPHAGIVVFKVGFSIF